MKPSCFCIFPLALTGLVLLLLTGCAQTVVKNTWTAPTVSALPFTKIFVLAITPNDMNRHLAENAVVAQIKTVHSVASFELLPDILDTKDKAKVIQAIKDSQADGLVVLRLMSTDSKVTTGVNTALALEYVTFSSYYGTVYDVGAYFASDPRSMYVDRIFGIETKIYDAKTEKLLWSGETQSTKNTVNDHDVGGLLTDVAQVIKSELKSQRLIR